ncbi:MAG: O-antigen translocase [Paludibacter sp.]|nr:O-antigen translocase [Paludibacter sp.]MDD4426890.1 O-antigen translocase [Paludibacter sp.]
MLFQYLKNKLKSDLVKVISLTAITNLIKIGINLITTKVIAVLVGPNGVALLGQFTNLLTTLTTTSTGGISNGVIKYVSQYEQDEKQYYGYVNVSLSITLVFSILTSFFLIILSKQICISLFGDVTYLSIIYITAFTIILYAINSLLLSIINGKKLYNKFILINLLSSITGFVFTLILVYFFKTYGALLALATYQSVVIIITIYIIRKNKILSFNNTALSFSKEKWRKLLGFSLMALVALIWPLANILIRSTLITHVSTDSAGIWEGMNKVSVLISAITGTAISTYFLPRFSEIGENKILRHEIVSGLKVIVVVTFTILTCLYLFRITIINILFTSEFISMKNLFLYQLSGDFFWVVKMLLTVILVAKAMTKKYIILEIVFGLMYIAISILLIYHGFGMESVPIAHLIYNLLYFITMLYVFRKLLFSNEEII